MGFKDRVKEKLTRNDSVTDTPWITASPESPTFTKSIPTIYDGMERGMPEPTTAAFSPNQQTASAKRNPSSVLIHQKSPLLVATPPQVTRALAYSHPFILPLNYLAGLTSWTSGDPWESTLLLFGFWFVVLYGDYFARVAGPIVLIGILIAGMYARKYSPLSSAAWDKETRKRSDSDSQQRKSLDEILETLQMFTTRCELMLDPLVRMTEFLSTQDSATSQTARPSLTSMFTRILAVTPIWVILTLPPLRIITTRRLVLVIGTILLTWHSEQARASRAILWRSRSVRRFCSLVTGLQYSGVGNRNSLFISSRAAVERILSNRGGANQDVRFTFGIFENQRRWIALGYTSSLLPADRSNWTDEQLEACPDKDNFFLPDTEHETSIWRWVPGSEWKLDAKWTDDPTPPSITTKTPVDKEAWTYYDNKWRGPSRLDDWSKWTRRRRWIRDAELVELSPADLAARQELRRKASSSDNSTPSTTRPTTATSPTHAARPSLAPSDAGYINAASDSDNASIATVSKRKGWFARRRTASQRGLSIDQKRGGEDAVLPVPRVAPSTPPSTGYEAASPGESGYRESQFHGNGTEGMAF